jgi:hypothetical protein
VDQYRFDADLDRLSILIPIRILILPWVLHIFQDQNIFSNLLTAVPVYIVFIFLFSVIGDIILNVMDSELKFSGQRYSLALHLVKMDTDPDPQKLFIITVGAKSTWIKRVCQNLVNCRRNISAQRRRRELQFSLFGRSWAGE